MKTTKLLALLLALVMVLSCFAGCKKPIDNPGTEGSKPAEDGVATYTYRDYITKPATVWNPLNCKTAQDRAIMQYLVTPLVTMGVKDTEKGEFQWVYKAATAITDVTKDNKADLSKYGVAANADEGYVFEIKLNADMKWQDGTAINADTYVDSMKALLDSAAKNSQATLFCTGAAAVAGGNSYYTGSSDNFEATVGFYKVDDTTIRYVCQSQMALDDFLSFCGNITLVQKDLYAKGNYGTSPETTMSYGPYKLSTQDDKQFVLVQNENYYQYEKKEDGTLYAETDYQVDGENVQAYQTTKIIIDVMTDEAAEEAFTKGELSRWTPSADKIADYLESSQLRQEDTEETYAFFFNTNASALQKLDSKGNKNAAVVSNINFRQAFSRAMDRKDWVTATAGFKPAWYLLNSQFYYDGYKDATTVYRDSNQAMQAIVDLYGLHYIDGAEFETLEAAYGSISAKAGFYLEDAKELMLQACTELVKAGLYQQGAPVEIKVAYSGEFGDAEKAQLDKVNEYLNAAVAGSGFGAITLVGAGNVADCGKAVSNGEYAIGYGAKGGDKYAAFTNMQLYYDAETNAVDELGCWNPATETLSIEIRAQKVTKTLKEWSYSLVGDGEYASAPIGIKLDIAAAMELAILANYYRIPMAAACNAYLQSYQVRDYAEQYNAMYGFGGFELMSYDYTDGEWAEYVSKSNGALSYE